MNQFAEGLRLVHIVPERSRGWRDCRRNRNTDSLIIGYLLQSRKFIRNKIWEKKQNGVC